MSFDLERIDQFAGLMNEKFCRFYEQIATHAASNSHIAYAAPVIGIADMALSSVQAIGGVGEAAIKGVTNVFVGGASCNGTALKMGGAQLALGACVVGVLSIPIIFVRTIRITAKMFADPQNTSEYELAAYRQKVLNASLQYVQANNSLVRS
jgi:hypothetical protein